MKTWQLQEAKSKFSELINLADNDSPQLVTKNGKPIAYVVSTDIFEKLKGSSIKQTLLSRPHKEIDLSIIRSPDLPREIEL